jgi:hypothetical protein
MILFESVFLLALVACNSPTSPTATATQAPPTATTVPPTQTALPTAEPTATPQAASPFESFPGTQCCNGTPVEPGEYALPSWTGLPLTLEVGDGWQVINEQGARLFMLGKGESMFNDPTQAFVFIAIPDGDPQAVLASIKNDQALTAQGEIIETTIAGFPGLQLDLTAKPNPDYRGNNSAEVPPGVQFLTSVGKYFAEGFLWTTWSAEAQLRFIALEIGEDVLLIQIDSAPAEFEPFATEADNVLQSLKLQ